MNWTRKQVSIMAIVAITAFMSTFLISSINIALPAIEKTFELNAVTLSWIVTAFLLATAGMSMCSVGLIAFSFLSASTPLIVIIGILIWVGLGFAFFSSPNMNTIMSLVDKTQLGLASGTAATMRVVGQITSMTIAAFFFAGMFGTQTIELVSDSLFMGAVKWGFLSFALISLAGIYFSYNRGGKPETE